MQHGTHPEPCHAAFGYRAPRHGEPGYTTPRLRFDRWLICAECGTENRLQPVASQPCAKCGARLPHPI